METKIGCAPDVPLQRLLAFLGLLYEYADGVAALVAHLPTAAQLLGLKSGLLDLALVHEPYPDDEIATHLLFPGEPLAAFVGVGHRFAERRAVSAEALAGHELIVVPRRAEPFVHDRIVGYAALHGVRLGDMREAPSSDPRDLLFAVSNGHGVAVGARSALRAVGDIAGTVVAVPFEPALSMPDTRVAWTENRWEERRSVRALAQAVAEQLAPPS